MRRPFEPSQYLSIRYTERMAEAGTGSGRDGNSGMGGLVKNQRLLEPIGDIPPAEHEELYYRSQESQAEVARLKERSLRRTRGGSVSLLSD